MSLSYLKMTELEKLTKEREVIRKADRSLTDKIKLARKAEAKTKIVAPDLDSLRNSLKEYKSTNAELRRLVAVLLKDKHITYKATGKELGVCPNRARDLVYSGYNQLRAMKYGEDNE